MKRRLRKRSGGQLSFTWSSTGLPIRWILRFEEPENNQDPKNDDGGSGSARPLVAGGSLALQTRIVYSPRLLLRDSTESSGGFSICFELTGSREDSFDPFLCHTSSLASKCTMWLKWLPVGATVNGSCMTGYSMSETVPSTRLYVLACMHFKSWPSSDQTEVQGPYAPGLSYSLRIASQESIYFSSETNKDEDQWRQNTPPTCSIWCQPQWVNSLTTDSAWRSSTRWQSLLNSAPTLHQTCNLQPSSYFNRTVVIPTVQKSFWQQEVRLTTTIHHLCHSRTGWHLNSTFSPTLGSLKVFFFFKTFISQPNLGKTLRGSFTLITVKELQTCTVSFLSGIAGCSANHYCWPTTWPIYGLFKLWWVWHRINSLKERSRVAACYFPLILIW